MDKSDLVSQMAKDSKLTKKDCETALSGIMYAIETTLSKGEKVVLVDFGTFDVRHRKERKGRNPKTNTELLIPATKVPAFKAGKALKASIK